MTLATALRKGLQCSLVGYFRSCIVNKSTRKELKQFTLKIPDSQQIFQSFLKCHTRSNSRFFISYQWSNRERNTKHKLCKTWVSAFSIERGIKILKILKTLLKIYIRKSSLPRVFPANILHVSTQFNSIQLYRHCNVPHIFGIQHTNSHIN